MATQRRAAIVFVHGLAKKPPADELLKIWRWALERDNPRPDVFPAPNKGIRLGDLAVPHLMNYWADVFYGQDHETDLSSYYESTGEGELEAQDLGGVAPVDVLPPPPDAEGRLFVAAVEAKLAANAALMPSAPAPRLESVVVAGKDLELAAWLPESVKAAVIKKAAKEAYYYLFDRTFTRADGQQFAVRRVLRQRLIDQLRELASKAERLVIVSHSMGTMLAYDVLRLCPECPPVHTLVTLGSPLGITEVQEKLRAPGAKGVDFPAAKLQRWVNIYDPLDLVCGADPRFGNDYAAVDGKRVEDVRESNWGNWRHTSTHYLAGTRLRATLAEAVA